MTSSTSSSTRSRRATAPFVAAVALALLTAGCTGGTSTPSPGGSPSGSPAVSTPVDAASAPALRELAGDRVAFGVAVAGGGHAGMDLPEPLVSDPAYATLVSTHFSSLTPENQLKWEYVRPDEKTFAFEGTDAIVDFAEEHGQVVRGHTLLWHSQNPAWLEQGDRSAAELRELLRAHVTTVVGRYAGRIAQWDVANEIFDEHGELRTTENLWLRELGVDVVADVFRWAHEADPEAVLFLNDYDAERIGPKSDAYLALATDLLAKDVPLGGFGVQGHLDTEYPFPDDLAANLQRFADLGLAVAVTEADVRVPVDSSGVATEADLAQQSEYFTKLLTACLDVTACTSFTVWGLTDAHSWVPFFFDGKGAATLLDEEWAPKPSFLSLSEVLTAG